MINQTNVYLDSLRQHQEVDDNGDQVRNVHDEYSVGAPNFRHLISNTPHVNPEVGDSDETAGDP